MHYDHRMHFIQILNIMSQYSFGLRLDSLGCKSPNTNRINYYSSMNDFDDSIITFISDFFEWTLDISDIQ